MVYIVFVKPMIMDLVMWYSNTHVAVISYFLLQPSLRVSMSGLSQELTTFFTAQVLLATLQPNLFLWSERNWYILCIDLREI